MNKEDLSNWCFKNVFKTVTTTMNIVRIYPFTVKNRLWYIQALFFMIVNATCLIFLLNSVFQHEIRSGNYMDASKNFAIIILCFNSNFKYYLMLYYRDSFAGLISTIDKDYELAKEFNEDEKNIVVSYGKKGINVCKLWVFVGPGTGLIFPAKAFYLMLYYYFKNEAQLVPMFDMTFPGFIETYKSTFLGYIGTFALCFVFDSFATCIFTGFEPLIAIFTSHISAQLELLSLNIRKAITESVNEEDMKLKLRSINIKWQQLFRFLGHVQNNYMLLMELNMKGTTLLLPCGVFLIVQDYLNNNFNVEYIFLVIAGLVHFLVPCYFCTLMMESSVRLKYAIYSCGWESCRSAGVRKTVLLMLIRTTKHFNIQTVFYSISLDTFSTMCRHAYSLFNLMIASFT